MKALGIIGYHHSGKTTLAESLIRELTRQGHKVASIKDIHNDSYHADTPGSNSWRHAQAGAGQVFARGPRDAALILTPAPDLSQMLRLLRADWLVIEGYRDAAVPKIICADTIEQAAEQLDDTAIALSGRLALKHDQFRHRPVFRLPEQLAGLMALVERKCFDLLPQSDPECCSACGKSCYQLAAEIVQGRAQRSDCVLDGSSFISLEQDGAPITMVPFVQKLLADGLVAFLGNLKGVDPSGEFKITLRNPK